jgi:hypothetical protein
VDTRQTPKGTDFDAVVFEGGLFVGGEEEGEGTIAVGELGGVFVERCAMAVMVYKVTRVGGMGLRFRRPCDESRMSQVIGQVGFELAGVEGGVVALGVRVGSEREVRLG